MSRPYCPYWSKVWWTTEAGGWTLKPENAISRLVVVVQSFKGPFNSGCTIKALNPVFMNTTQTSWIEEITGKTYSAGINGTRYGIGVATTGKDSLACCFQIKAIPFPEGRNERRQQ